MKREQAEKKVILRALPVIALGMVFALGAVPLRAADRSYAPRSPERMTAHLGERLGLTSGQMEQLAPILEEGFSRNREIEKKYGRQERELRRARKEERRAVEADLDERLEKVLTGEQMDEFRALREERRAHLRDGDRGRGRGKGMRGARRSPDKVLMRLSERLDLTPEQEDRLLPILEENLEQRMELRANLRSRGDDERRVARRQLEDLAADLEDRAAAVLTAEQMDEFTQIREERRSMRRDRSPYRGKRIF